MPISTPICDIVLPVFNGLSRVRNCIQSLCDHTSDEAYRLYIVDDGSDAKTATALEHFCKDRPYISLHRNPVPMGWVRSCNMGITLGKAPYVVLINGGVIVTPGWLRQLVLCAGSDPRIAAVNPLAHHAPHLDLPMPPGANFYDMAWVLSQQPCRPHPEIVTGAGFCFLLRRAALEKVGYFDEAYGQGEDGDADLCMRLVTSGFRVVSANDVYVYYDGQGMTAEDNARCQENLNRFHRRWSQDYPKRFFALRTNHSLRSLRVLFLEPRRLDVLNSMKNTYRRMRQCWRRREIRAALMEAAQGITLLAERRRTGPTRTTVRRFTRPGCLIITYILPEMASREHMASVVRWVNELVLLGVGARVVALREDPGMFRVFGWRFLSTPIVFDGVPDLLRNFADSDITVATHWTTASWVAQLVRSGRGGHGVYLARACEGGDAIESDSTVRHQVLSACAMLAHRIVQSDLLKTFFSERGYAATKVAIGVDLDVFYPREVPRPPHPVLLVIQGLCQSGGKPTHLIEIIQQVRTRLPDLEVIICGEQDPPFPFPYRHEGAVWNPDRRAELYAQADVLLDDSSGTGGHSILEALACGIACVLPAVGHVAEYAKNGENCLLIGQKNSTTFSDAIVALLQSPSLRKKLAAGGLQTVRSFCHKRETREMLHFFKTLRK